MKIIPKITVIIHKIEMKYSQKLIEETMKADTSLPPSQVKAHSHNVMHYHAEGKMINIIFDP